MCRGGTLPRVQKLQHMNLVTHCANREAVLHGVPGVCSQQSSVSPLSVPPTSQPLSAKGQLPRLHGRLVLGRNGDISNYLSLLFTADPAPRATPIGPGGYEVVTGRCSS